MLGNLRGSEWIIIAAILALLFGAKRLPDAARGLGRSLRIFKAETQGLTASETPSEPPPTASVVSAPLEAPSSVSTAPDAPTT
jgi:sec-independent protein translocase protein TatA